MATATTVIAGSSGKRQINTSYEDFLAHYGTAAYATAPVSPKHKASVEAAVKVVTNWVIGALADRQFTLLDDLNAAILTQVDAVNNRVPFRDQQVCRTEIFEAEEQQFLTPLPAEPYVPVQWRKSKVAPNWHITVATCHYSVPYTLIGSTVDVRIRGQELAVMVDGEVVACHQVQHKRGVYSTDADRHGPPGLEIPGNLWTKDYFLAQARRVGPNTRNAIEALFAATVITAQAYQPARNILGLGKGDNKPILEEACRRLTAGTSARAVSYNAVKTMMAAIRAEQDQRRTTRPSSPPDPRGDQQPPTHPRRSGLIGGSEQFRLNKLTSQPTNNQDSLTEPADADHPHTTAQDNQGTDSKSPDTQSPSLDTTDRDATDSDVTDSDVTKDSDDEKKAGH
ncbi:transposase [Corynebacterium cystitidis]|uniref:Integrase catalytic domain-containing protein n=1 Tax=Corynebacterium cystitidis DSM 20524 TaxID=1121357 RepID=A0A1H9QNE7_9CORY|nr:hypothetical protein SAMN05661109_00613 [Corynebacterium cystitidis DSM 20524]SNV84549.1 transposase [Corynebacterium cystitidis]